MDQMAMKRILWIEEEAKVDLIQFKKPLVRAGYLVDIASDATEALHLLNEKNYDALIFDLIIPQGKEFETKEFYVGYELLRRILKLEFANKRNYSAENVMVFTAVDDEQIHRKIRDLGVGTILTKHLNKLSDLKNKVDKLLEKGVKNGQVETNT